MDLDLLFTAVALTTGRPPDEGDLVRYQLEVVKAMQNAGVMGLGDPEVRRDLLRAYFLWHYSHTR